jgi:outer membrane protein OmpA-like peptidoglycan-associated protein
MDAGEVIAVEPPRLAGEPVMLRLRLAGRFRTLIGDPATARVQLGSDGVWSARFVKILPGRPTRQALPASVVLRSEPPADLTEELIQTSTRLQHLLGNIDKTMEEVQSGQGTLGQLVKNDKLYQDLTDTASQTRQTIEQVRGMVSAIKQNADALKSMPIIRSYVVDAHKLLHRPECRFERRWLPEDRLFQPGQAVLTNGGRQELARLAKWLNAHKAKGSEVVVAAYAAPGQPSEAAQTLTQKQSEVVCQHLTSEYKVHKTGWWWWSRRAVQPLGLGTMPSPIPADARAKLPAPRVEVLVFVPQG